MKDIQKIITELSALSHICCAREPAGDNIVRYRLRLGGRKIVFHLIREGVDLLVDIFVAADGNYVGTRYELCHNDTDASAITAFLEALLSRSKQEAKNARKTHERVLGMVAEHRRKVEEEFQA